MAVHPGFTESRVHDFWTLPGAHLGAAHLHLQGPGEAMLLPHWKGSLPTPAPEMRVDLTVTFFEAVGV